MAIPPVYVNKPIFNFYHGKMEKSKKDNKRGGFLRQYHSLNFLYYFHDKAKSYYRRYS